MIETLKSRGWLRSRWRMTIWAVIAALLAAPLVAMQFTPAVKWTPADFGYAAALLGGAGLAYELIARSPLKNAAKIATGCFVSAIVIAVWAQGAVGLF